MSKEFYKKYTGRDQEQINNDFAVACASGKLQEVKYLLTTKEIPLNADIAWGNYSGIIWACMNNHPEVVKYLLTSPDIKEHPPIHTRGDAIFKMSLFYNAHDVLNYLINDVQIEKTAEISLALESNPSSIAENMFLNRELQEQLETNFSKTKKPKL